MMKTNIILLTVFALLAIRGTAQNTTPQSASMDKYAKEWAEVREFQNSGLLQSSAPKVEAIYKSALQEKDYEQVIKAVIFRLNIIALKEDKDTAVFNILNTLKNDAQTLPQPAKSIIYSMLAQMYEDYYDQNRWKINQRTYTAVEQDDIKTYSARKLAEETVKYYELSLEEANILQNTPIDKYKEILEGRYDVQVQPTIYDLLANRALAYYASNFNIHSLPQQTFVINDPKYFADAKDFASLNIQTPDILSVNYLSLRIYQKLLRFYLDKSEYSDALINTDLRRIEFLKSKGNYSDNNKLYEKALNQMGKSYEKYGYYAHVLYQKAVNYYNKRGELGSGFEDDNEYQSGYLKAKEICETIKKKYPGRCEKEVNLLLKCINDKILEIRFENVQLPEKPFLASVKFRNISAVYQTIYKLTEKQVIDLNNVGKYKNNKYYDIKDFMESVTVKPIERTVPLPKQTDFRQYATEIKIDPLEKGAYLIFISNAKDPLKSDVYTYTLLQISQLAEQNRKIEKTMTAIVTDRTSGKPIRGAVVTLYENESKTLGSFTSNENGIAQNSFDNKLNSFNLYHKIKYEDDQLFVFNDSHFGYNENNSNKNSAIMFTDRSIYRPGQTVFFKAILYANSTDNKEILKNYPVTVKFYDANRQIIAEKKFQTNDFGSLDGNFVIPQGLLNGSFMIKCENYSTTFIQVEEYKRPTFEVKFDTVRENYKFNDNVKIVVTAKALAGYVIDNAKVQYRVQRSITHPTHRIWFPYFTQRETGSGIVETDENGKATITFQALADDVKDDELIYNYTVIADITDVNGETRSGTTDVRISNKPLLISVNLPEKVNIEKLEDYTIETTNLNGNATPGTIDVEIISLKSPEKILRRRSWNPYIEDFIQSIPEQEFRKNFPRDEYNNELNPQYFANKNSITKYTIDTEKTKKLDLSSLQKSGYYKLILKAQNRQGITVNDTTIFRLIDNKQEKITSMEDWLTTVKEEAEPGENVEFLLAGGNNDSYIYCEVIHKDKLVESKWIKTGTTQQKISFPVKEEYRGGFAVQFSMVQDNRIYSATKHISVPFTNKMLDVKLATFRDKLLPGENEKWTMLVRNKNGEKEMAEIVASLYDASLDAFRWHYWANIDAIYNQNVNTYLYWWVNNTIGQISYFNVERKEKLESPNPNTVDYAKINWFEGFYKYALSKNAIIKNIRSERGMIAFDIEHQVAIAEEHGVDIAKQVNYSVTAKKSDVYPMFFGYGVPTSGNFYIRGLPSSAGANSNREMSSLSEIQTRTNFNETAFFYPQLRTDENGEVLIEFTVPEALTRWKLLGFAHTKDLKIGTYANELITRKQVAISANPPRFFRENDEMELTAKMNNLTESDLEGKALLRLYDAVNMQPLDNIIVSDKSLSVNVKKGQSVGLRWKLKIPKDIQAITYKVTAQAGTHSDGEEKTVPVLTNSMLVTETMPFSVRAGQSKSFTLNKLVHNKSNTLRNHSLTLEYTSAPAWYAVQALPYIMEYPYECAEQTFSRYYANSLATAIINKTPRIKQIFETWNTLNSDALISNLEKNQELKQTILEETPWVMQAKNETENKKRIGLLFDLNRMSNESNRAFNKLQKAQSSDGGFPWFEGNPSNRYITQYIVAGLAHLKKLDAIPSKNQSEIQNIVSKGFTYLDGEIWKDYDGLIRGKANLEEKQINALQINYLYACSFEKHIPDSDNAKKASDYYLLQTEQFWTKFSIFEKAMAALILNRFDKQATAKKIIASLKENALQSEEMGMYWKDNVAGYLWHQAPIETQAIIIEAFNEVSDDIRSVEEMKIWLLRNKQTNDWKTTKATSEAIYALLMTGSNLLDESKPLKIRIAGKPLEKTVLEPVKPEPGTGYVKTGWKDGDIIPQMGKITVENPNNKGIAWGGMYWQYFEQLDKITSAVTNLKMTKRIFKKTNTSKGPELEEIQPLMPLHVGDLVTVRVVIKADRDFEYVHLKDMRASGFEPVSTVSGHRYQDGLWYYESVGDASNNYFITDLRKGTYVFEYDLRVSHSGDFSNGITTFQCMYAPEFSAHSEGIRIKAE